MHKTSVGYLKPVTFVHAYDFCYKTKSFVKAFYAQQCVQREFVKQTSKDC